MVSSNTIEHDLKDKMKDLSSEEVKSLLDSLMWDMYMAYDVLDMDTMKQKYNELENIQNVLERNFNNIRGYTCHKLAYYESQLSHLRFRRLCLERYRKDALGYVRAYGLLETQYNHLIELLEIYFWNYSNYSTLTDVMIQLSSEESLPITFPITDRIVFGECETNKRLMNMLGDYIGDVRDNILDSIEDIDNKYFIPEGRFDWDDEISYQRDLVHEIIKDDFYDFIKERGIVDVEFEFIPLYKLSYELNEAYVILKQKIEYLFEEDNGFDTIRNSLEKLYSEEHSEQYIVDMMGRFPKYNIRENKFIPPEHNTCEEIYGDWWYIIKTPHHLSRWDYYYHDFSELDEN